MTETRKQFEFRKAQALQRNKLRRANAAKNWFEALDDLAAAHARVVKWRATWSRLKAAQKKILNDQTRLGQPRPPRRTVTPTRQISTEDL